METATINKLKKAASRITEERFLHAGRVLEVRPWAGMGMTEIDLHLPEAAMQQWLDVPYIKFHVAPFTYRDYTPFGWDAEASTCSLLVDTGHQGPGSYWAKQLQCGDTVQYLKIDFTHQTPHLTAMVIGLGDSSSLAHLLALRQLTLPNTRFDGAVLLHHPGQMLLLREYFGNCIQVLNDTQQLSRWLVEQQYCITHTRFYLTGQNQLVAELRRVLRSLGHEQLRVKGFWN
jgi:NADPH-dependent ferric siderophore reductase